MSGLKGLNSIACPTLKRYYNDNGSERGLKVLVVGLTGGIASGKSTISACLRDLGAAIIDADILAREAVLPQSPAWLEIVERFGAGVLNSCGHLDRKKMAAIIFNSAQDRAKLNRIIHPRVIKAAGELIDKYKKEGRAPLIVVDAPLLIETGMVEMVDEVWVVSVPEEIQLERLIAREHLTREIALERLNSQMPLKEKLLYADRIIDNSGDREQTLKYIDTLWKEIVHGRPRQKSN